MVAWTRVLAQTVGVAVIMISAATRVKFNTCGSVAGVAVVTGTSHSAFSVENKLNSFQVVVNLVLRQVIWLAIRIGVATSCGIMGWQAIVDLSAKFTITLVVLIAGACATSRARLVAGCVHIAATIAVAIKTEHRTRFTKVNLSTCSTITSEAFHAHAFVFAWPRHLAPRVCTAIAMVRQTIIDRRAHSPCSKETGVASTGIVARTSVCAGCVTITVTIPAI